MTTECENTISFIAQSLAMTGENGKCVSAIGCTLEQGWPLVARWYNPKYASHFIIWGGSDEDIMPFVNAMVASYTCGVLTTETRHHHTGLGAPEIEPAAIFDMMRARPHERTLIVIPDIDEFFAALQPHQVRSFVEVAKFAHKIGYNFVMLARYSTALHLTPVLRKIQRATLYGHATRADFAQAKREWLAIGDWEKVIPHLESISSGQAWTRSGGEWVIVSAAQANYDYYTITHDGEMAI